MSLVELSSKHLINKNNICIIQQLSDNGEPDTKYKYKIIFNGGTTCEFDCSLDMAAIKEVCNT